MAKCAQRLECLGAVDELSACIGLACALLREPPAFGDTARLAASLGRIQDELSGLCADLATPVARGKTRIAARHVTALERHIDAWTGRLPTLRAFIRPGGSPAAACLHLAFPIQNAFPQCGPGWGQPGPVAETAAKRASNCGKP